MTVDNAQPLRVLLADDEFLVRGGLAMLIDAEEDLAVIGEVDDGVQAVASATSLSPDVIVMDVRAAHGRRRYPPDRRQHRRSGRAHSHHVRRRHRRLSGIRAGASRFIPKNAAPRKLAEAIRIVAAGDAYLHLAVASRRCPA